VAESPAPRGVIAAVATPISADKSLIASAKAVLAARFDDPAYERVLPPLTPLAERERAKLVDEVLALLN